MRAEARTPIKEWKLMWIVRLALRRPYTFVVCAMLVMILGIIQILRMPTDIFPEINIPVISVAFSYTGMPADEMEKRIVGNFERILTTTVNDIEHIESQSLYGIGVVKIYFQKGANVDAATAQVTAVSQTVIRMMPTMSRGHWPYPSTAITSTSRPKPGCR